MTMQGMIRITVNLTGPVADLVGHKYEAELVEGDEVVINLQEEE